MNATNAERNSKADRSSSPLITSTSNGEPSDGDRLAELDNVEADAEGGVERTEEQAVTEKEEKVTWASLPHRRQLIILTLARLSEPLVQTSLQVGSFANKCGLNRTR